MWTSSTCLAFALSPVVSPCWSSLNLQVLSLIIEHCHKTRHAKVCYGEQCTCTLLMAKPLRAWKPSRFFEGSTPRPGTLQVTWWSFVMIYFYFFFDLMIITIIMTMMTCHGIFTPPVSWWDFSPKLSSHFENVYLAVLQGSGKHSQEKKIIQRIHDICSY